jgi:hypothetical protein
MPAALLAINEGTSVLRSSISPVQPQQEKQTRPLPQDPLPCPGVSSRVCECGYQLESCASSWHVNMPGGSDARIKSRRRCPPYLGNSSCICVRICQFEPFGGPCGIVITRKLQVYGQSTPVQYLPKTASQLHGPLFAARCVPVDRDYRTRDKVPALGHVVVNERLHQPIIVGMRA